MQISNADAAAIETSLQMMDLPPLFAAMAEYFGDRSFLADEFRPARPKIGTVPSTDGEYSDEVKVCARTLVMERLREGRLDTLSTGRGEIETAEILQFLTGESGAVFEDRLSREVTGELSKSTLDLSTKRVAIIGGGVSGITAAVKLQQSGADFTIFERNSELGGTWLLNAYPGCRLDTSNFAYSFSFLQKADWQHKYSPREEILDYLQNAARHFSLYDRVRLETKVTDATWDADQGSWVVHWTDAEGVAHEERFDVLVSAVGQLNQPKTPEIPGIDGFQGRQVHSSRWPSDLDISGMKVGVIGSGASGFQIVPAIGEQVDELVIFQRSAPWPSPEPAYEDPLPPGHLLLFSLLPTLHVWYRFWQFWAATEGRLPYAIIDQAWPGLPSTVSELNDQLRADLVGYLTAQYTDRPDLIDRVIPNYPPGAKRMVRDSGRWARTLQRPNVILETRKIERIKAQSVVVEGGKAHELDVLVLATGFHADKYLAGINVRGVNGLLLSDYWANRPRAYLGVTVPGFPNFFMLYGPNTNLVVNGSNIFMIECAADYMVSVLELMRAENATVVDTDTAALREFIKEVDDGNARRAWGLDSVTNWYKSESGEVTQNWPFGLSEYWAKTRTASTSAHRFR